MHLTTFLPLILPPFTLAALPLSDFSTTYVSSLIEELLTPKALNGSVTITLQIISSALPHLKALLARNTPIKRNGTSLFLLGEPYTLSGANIYWLGLDENVIPPNATSTQFYAPLNASYPTKERVTEATVCPSSQASNLVPNTRRIGREPTITHVRERGMWVMWGSLLISNFILAVWFIPYIIQVPLALEWEQWEKGALFT